MLRGIVLMGDVHHVGSISPINYCLEQGVTVLGLIYSDSAFGT